MAEIPHQTQAPSGPGLLCIDEAGSKTRVAQGRTADKEVGFFQELVDAFLLDKQPCKAVYVYHSRALGDIHLTLEDAFKVARDGDDPPFQRQQLAGMPVFTISLSVVSAKTPSHSAAPTTGAQSTPGKSPLRLVQAPSSQSSKSDVMFMSYMHTGEFEHPDLEGYHLLVVESLWPLMPLPETYQWGPEEKTVTYDPVNFGGPVLVPMTFEQTKREDKERPGLPSVQTAMKLVQQSWFRKVYPKDAAPSSQSHSTEMDQLFGAVKK